jgi:type I restriction enzyme M protein
MNNQEIVQKLWNLCNVLRDDGITYHQYVTELTYILFLKMAQEVGNEDLIPPQYRWEKFAHLDGVELFKHYKQALLDLGNSDITTGIVLDIYQNASTNIRKPSNLDEIFRKINAIDWHSEDKEGLGDLYEGLLAKNASESKGGAGQYFTPRPLIEVMVDIVAPQLGERINDPACGTFGFMIAAHQYIKKNNDFYTLESDQTEFQFKKAMSGVELVPETHRLALMNAILHGLEPEALIEGDTLTASTGENMKGYDVVLANPPFGTKKGGERTSRTDITYPTSNKQLNFLQHIYRSLKANDKARAAVVLPDNILTGDGEGAKVRKDLMEKCDLHTILRLPTGIFYAQGVKTNVLFFTRKKKEGKHNTPSVNFFDMRTNMSNFGKRTPLTKATFDEFVNCYSAFGFINTDNERWKTISRQEIEDKAFSLDFGLIRDENLIDHEDLPPIEELAADTMAALELAVDKMKLILQRIEKYKITADTEGGKI